MTIDSVPNGTHAMSDGGGIGHKPEEPVGPFWFDSRLGRQKWKQGNAFKIAYLHRSNIIIVVTVPSSYPPARRRLHKRLCARSLSRVVHLLLLLLASRESERTSKPTSQPASQPARNTVQAKKVVVREDMPETLQIISELLSVQQVVQRGRALGRRPWTFVFQLQRPTNTQEMEEGRGGIRSLSAPVP